VDVDVSVNVNVKVSVDVRVRVDPSAKISKAWAVEVPDDSRK